MPPPFRKHLFICTNERAPTNPKGCCASKGGESLRQRFKKLIIEHGLKGVVRANSAGCLDACEFGPTVAVYPDNVWYGGVELDDAEVIFNEHILGGCPVERLLVRRAPGPRGESE